MVNLPKSGEERNENLSATVRHGGKEFHFQDTRFPRRREPIGVSPAMSHSTTEVFVGDLSFFCNESHLFELFSNFGRVAATRIKRNDRTGQTLMYGFVDMQSLEEAENAAKILNDQIFMGRSIRVELSHPNKNHQLSLSGDFERKSGYQVHVMFVSHFEHDAIVLPSEEFLRTKFEPFGVIKDIAIKEYNILKSEPQQKGYCFITFRAEDEAQRATEALHKTTHDGILLSCNLSFRNPYTPEKGTKILPNPANKNNNNNNSSNYNAANNNKAANKKPMRAKTFAEAPPLSIPVHVSSTSTSSSSSPSIDRPSAQHPAHPAAHPAVYHPQHAQHSQQELQHMSQMPQMPPSPHQLFFPQGVSFPLQRPGGLPMPVPLSANMSFPAAQMMSGAMPMHVPLPYPPQSFPHYFPMPSQQQQQLEHHHQQYHQHPEQQFSPYLYPGPYPNNAIPFHAQAPYVNVSSHSSLNSFSPQMQPEHHHHHYHLQQSHYLHRDHRSKGHSSGPQ